VGSIPIIARPHPTPPGPLVRRVQRGAQGALELAEIVRVERPRGDVDLDVEPAELGLEGRVGDLLQHARVRHGRVLRAVDEVELDLQSQSRLGDVEGAVGEHDRERIQAPPDLGAESSAILPREALHADVVSHGPTLPMRSRGKRYSPLISLL
jgi:hypothetical protein